MKKDTPPRPRGRPRGRPRSVDPDAAVQAAMEAWWRSGPDGLSLNALCRLAGISKPALYRAFGGEDGLMDAALESYHRVAVAPLLEAFRSGLRFATVLDRVVVAMTQEDGRPPGCLFTKMRRAPDRLGPRTTARLVAMESERRAVFQDAWRRARVSGEVQLDLEPGLAGRYIDTQLHAVLEQMGAGEPPELVRAQARLALGAML